ncbi:MAG TPA: DUF4147 domain-containing protein [Nitrosopumilaceae archaeon]|nr:DUF4147 domain-containing protein [Nitrosopumilaceae archaeon]
MIIQNYRDLAKDPAKINALKIINAGLESAIPEKHLQKIITSKHLCCGKKIIHFKNYNSIYLLAFGKAADSMSKTVSDIIKFKNGIIVIPKGLNPTIKNKKFLIFKAGHPTPDETSLYAAKTIMNFLEKRSKGDLVIFLVSGGASSLLALPDGISLKDKILVTKKLLSSGASIQELNCVRKHLSKIKGGRLIESLKCDAASLILSDVIDDDLSSIASGTTYYDKTTFSDAIKVIKKYHLMSKLPDSIIHRLRLGLSGKILETPKKSKIPHHIVLRNRDCLQAMKKKSNELGFSSKTICISGNVQHAAGKLVSQLPKKKNSCIIFGGETTVHVKGTGKGGRNQEIVLHILNKIQKSKKEIVVTSLGTDGIDGNTKYAGAITTNISLPKNEIKLFLDNNDSNTFFKKYGGLIKTGYTHTNLMDIGLILY